MTTFKIALIGDAGVGTTSFIHKLMSGEFKKRYIPTSGVKINNILLNTNKGTINLSLYDVAGQEKYSTNNDIYYKDTNLAIIFFDLTSQLSFRNLGMWIKTYRKICPQGEIIVVGNKFDIGEKKVLPSQIREINYFENIPYFNISVKNNYQIKELLLQAIRMLINDYDITLINNIQSLNLAHL